VALDARNQRFRAVRSMHEDDGGAGFERQPDDARQRVSTLERLEQAEKVAGKFVARALPKYVEKARCAVLCRSAPEKKGR
jgi:hypothetical protein